VSVILVLIPLSIIFAACFLAAFIWAVRAGQFEDTCTPSMRVLTDEARARKATNPAAQPRPTANSIEAQTMAISEKPDDAPAGSMHPL